MAKRHYIIPVFVPHEGCPFDCVFCNQKKITGLDTSLEAEHVEERINEYINTIDTKKNPTIEIAFFGGSFTGISINKQSELLKIAQRWYEKGVVTDIRISTRPDYINKEILSNLKKYDVSIIELGVQSLDPQVLEKSNRGHSAEIVKYASDIIKDMGFKLGLQMMIGLPGDTREKNLSTAYDIISYNPNFVRIYPTLVIKGTALETQYINGLYPPLSLDAAISICKDLYIIFYKNGIDIIRIGLQPTDNIMEGKDLVAGPFHPSFRQLVESEVYLDTISEVFNSFPDVVNEVTFIVNPKNISTVIGNKKKNIIFFKRLLDINMIKVIGDESIKDHEIKILINKNIEITKKNL